MDWILQVLHFDTIKNASTDQEGTEYVEIFLPIGFDCNLTVT